MPNKTVGQEQSGMEGLDVHPKIFFQLVGSVLCIIMMALALFAGVGHAATQEYFGGKTLRIITLPAGGGFDLYSRAIAPHIGRHIPGNPRVVVENMGGRKLQKEFQASKPDGLTIGTFDLQILREVLKDRGTDFDVRKVEWIGAPVRSEPVCILMKASGISSFDRWMTSNVPIKLGSTRAGNQNSDVPNVLKAVLDLPIQIVPGYQGTRAIREAAHSGDVAGGCWGWESIKEVWREDLKSGNATVILQVTSRALAELPKVPVAIEIAKSDEARRLIQTAIHDPSALDKTYFLPPTTPNDLVLNLRKAFMGTMNDKEFLADARKANLVIDPLNGEELEKIVAGLFKMDSARVAKLRAILK